MRRFLTLLAVIVLVLLTDRAYLNAATWLHKAAQSATTAASPSKAPPRYVTAPVEKGEIRQVVAASGTLKAVATVEVSSQLSGQIATLLANFNDGVQQGQPLALLDQRSYEAEVAKATAAAKMAELAIETEKAKLRRAEINVTDLETQRLVLKARIDNVKARLRGAKLALERKQQLVQRGAGSQADFDDTQTKVDSEIAALQEAEALATAHEQTIAAARADLERARVERSNALAALPLKQAELRVAEINLDRTIIRAPISGIIIGRDVESGQTVAASLWAPTLFTIAGDLKDMEIHARIDEADIGAVAVDQKATFVVDAYPDKRFFATVKELRKAPQTLQNVVTYTVVLSAANSDNLLLPGMTAVVRIVTSETGPILKIPLAALRFAPQSEATKRRESGQALVWKLGARVDAQPVPVGIGPDDGAQVAVLSGSLREGDNVIVSELTETHPRRLFGIRIGF